MQKFLQQAPSFIRNFANKHPDIVKKIEKGINAEAAVINPALRPIAKKLEKLFNKWLKENKPTLSKK